MLCRFLLYSKVNQPHAHMWKWKCQSLSRVWLVATPGTVAHQALCLWHSLGKNIRVGSHSLLQGTFSTQGSNPGLLHCRHILYCLSPQGSQRQWSIKWQPKQMRRNLILYLGLPKNINGEPSHKPQPGFSKHHFLFSDCSQFKTEVLSLTSPRGNPPQPPYYKNYPFFPPLPIVFLILYIASVISFPPDNFLLQARILSRHGQSCLSLYLSFSPWRAWRWPD